MARCFCKYSQWNELLASSSKGYWSRRGSAHRRCLGSLSLSTAGHGAAWMAATSSQEHKLLWSKIPICPHFSSVKPDDETYVFPFSLSFFFFFPGTNVKKPHPLQKKTKPTPNPTKPTGHICKGWWIEETHKIRVFTKLLGLLLLLFSSRKPLQYFCCYSGSTGKSHFSRTVCFYFSVQSLWF